MSRRGTGRWLLALALGTLAGCGYRPAHFADRAPIWRVADDRPVPLPRRHTFLEELYQADVYVRRELVGVLDPRRPPPALDVNSLDEVPESSWFAPPRDPSRPFAGCRADGPPRPPLAPRAARLRRERCATRAGCATSWYPICPAARACAPGR